MLQRFHHQVAGRTIVDTRFYICKWKVHVFGLSKSTIWIGTMYQLYYIQFTEKTEIEIRKKNLYQSFFDRSSLSTNSSTMNTTSVPDGHFDRKLCGSTNQPIHRQCTVFDVIALSTTFFIEFFFAEMLMKHSINAGYSERIINNSCHR